MPKRLKSNFLPAKPASEVKRGSEIMIRKLGVGDLRPKTIKTVESLVARDLSKLSGYKCKAKLINPRPESPPPMQTCRSYKVTFQLEILAEDR